LNIGLYGVSQILHAGISRQVLLREEEERKAKERAEREAREQEAVQQKLGVRYPLKWQSFYIDIGNTWEL